MGFVSIFPNRTTVVSIFAQIYQDSPFSKSVYHSYPSSLHALLYNLQNNFVC